MNLRQIEAFKTLMLAGSVTAAAEQLRLTQPTISKLIAQLESETTLKLFDRTRGRLVPRPEAYALLRDVEKTLNALQEVGRNARQLARSHMGHIRIASIGSIGTSLIPRAVASFIKTRPQTTATLYVRSSSYIRERVSAHLADIGFVSEGPMASGTLVSCFQERPGAICILPAHHPLRKKRALHAKDFDDEAFISVGRETHFRHQIERAFLDADVNRRLILQTNHFATAYALVAQGAGVTIVDPFSALAYFGRGVRLRPFLPEIPFRVNLIRPASQASPLIVEEFLAHLIGEQSALNVLLKDLITRE
jgi:DNA-binding transcriptional LysR family regulator